MQSVHSLECSCLFLLMNVRICSIQYINSLVYKRDTKVSCPVCIYKYLMAVCEKVTKCDLFFPCMNTKELCFFL